MDMDAETITKIQEMPEYKCPACDKSFHDNEAVLDHEMGHGIHERGCIVPGCHHTSGKHLFRHVSIRHPSLCTYHCSFCTRAFVHHVDKSQHEILKHGFDLNTPTCSSNLNKFIETKLQPSESFNAMTRRTVDKVCSSFKRSMSSLKEIIKGGSSIKGTAIEGKADIKLVFIFNTLKNGQQLTVELPRIQAEIEQRLKNGTNSDFKVEQRTIKKSKFSVQFTVDVVVVEILPTFDISDPSILYKQMQEGPESLIPFYSASLVKLQVEFVSPMPANVKNLIRLVKYWRQAHVTETATRRRLPTSYVLELITIHLWECAGKPSSFDTAKAFHGVMKALVDVQTFQVIWENNYFQSIVSKGIREERPLVLDPANPFNNVCSEFDWDEIQPKAEETLRSPMLRDITSSTWY